MTVRIRLLGGFEVQVDGVPVPSQAWSRRSAASLVKLLALADDRRLHREQVVEALWPGTPWDAAAPRLHKAAHYARRALGGEPGAVVLRNEVVALLPDAEVSIDLPELERAARQALAEGTAEAAATALDAYGGPLLPDDALRAVDRGAPRGRAGPAPGPAPAGRPVGGAAGGGAGRRAGPPGAGPGERRPGRRTRGAAALRADGPGAAARAGHRPVPGGAGAAGVAGAAARRADGPLAGHPAGRPPRRRRPDPRAPGARPGRPRQHAAAHRAAGRGQVRRARPRRWRSPTGGAGAPGAAPPPPSRGPGRTRRCWRRSATCAGGTRRCSTGWTTPTGRRSSARCPGGT